MPRVKIDYVVSFSSEDPNHQANNLLAWEVNKKKWLCPKGEPSCSVVLQLSKAVKIGAVHVGCHLAATVEVLVGRSEAPAEQYEVLVPRCVVLSPSESRRGDEAGPGGQVSERVRSFSDSQLAAGAARDQRWDRVRVVCTQPYNKHCMYGLSFVHVFEPEATRGPAPAAPVAPVAPAVPPRLTNFDTFSSDEEEFRPGELFSKLQGTPSTSTSTESQIKQASSQALKNISESSSKLVKTPINKPQHRRDTNTDVNSNRQRDHLMYTDDDYKPHGKIDHIVQRHKDEKSKEDAKNKDKAKSSKDDLDTSRKRERDGNSKDKDSRQGKDDRHDKDDRHSRSNTTPRNNHGDKGSSSSQKRKEDSRPSQGERKDDVTKGADGAAGVGVVVGGVVAESSILGGVVCVLSGYVNPARGHLRRDLVALGAAVLHDWGPTCTHLICAFPNTPKLRAVRAASTGTGAGAGGSTGAVVPAVQAEWVSACRTARRRLPWQWFATEKAHRLQPTPLPPPPESGPAAETARPDEGIRKSTADAPPRPESGPAGDDRGDEECDTDDEIEKVLQKQKKRRLRSPSPSPAPACPAGPASPSPDALSLSNDSDVAFVRDERMQGHVSLSDSDDTASEPEGHCPRAELVDPGAALPDFFEGYTFVVESDVERAQFDRTLLVRYVRAYGGLVLEDRADADYVVTAGTGSGTGTGTGTSPGPRLVPPAWVWRCHEAAALCPHN